MVSAERGFDTVERWLNSIGVVFTILLMFMVVTQVTARYLFNSPLVGYIDIMQMLMVPLVFLCIAYCQREGGHIRVEVFMTRVLKGGRRYHLFESLLLFLSLAAFGIIAFYSVKDVVDAYKIGDTTLNIFFPIWPVMTIVAIGAIFLCIRFLVQLIRNDSWTVKGINRPVP